MKGVQTMSFFSGQKHESPAAADERRANELESCRKCKKAVDGFTWDMNGGYCPACVRAEANNKSKNNRKKLW